MLSWNASALGQIEEKQVLSNGDVIATRQGVDGLWMSIDKAKKLNDSLDELDRLRAALPLAEKDIDQLHAALALTQKQAEASDNTAKIALQVAENRKQMFDDEHQLRLDAEKFVYKPGRVTKLFNSVPLQLGLKLAVPAFQMWRCQ